MDEIAFTPEIHFTPEEPIKFEPELPPLNPDLAPATSPEELAAKNFYGAKRTGVPLSEGKAQGFGEMISRPLVNVARSVTPQQFADAVDSLAVSGAQAEGAIDPEEAQAMLAEPSRKPKKIEAFLAGAQQAAASSVNFFTSPLGVATLGTVGAPAAIQRSIAAAFTADMAKQSPQFVRELSTAIKEGDPEKIGRSLTGMGLNAALIKEGLKSVFRPAAIESAPADNISSSDAVEGKMVDIQPAPEAAPVQGEAINFTPEAKAAPAPEPPTQGEFVGMGGATPTEFQAAPKTPTGIKNATVDAERETRGLPPAMQSARRSFGEVWDRAMAKIDQDPAYPDRLLSELRKEPRALTDQEDATLLQRQVDLQNEYGKATRDLAQAYDDGRADDVATQKVRVSELSDQLLDIYNIGKAAGTETARGLSARRMMAFEDFSLAKMELDKRAVKGGEPLTDTERAQVVELNQKIAATQKAFDDYVAATDERLRQAQMDRAHETITRQPPERRAGRQGDTALRIEIGTKLREEPSAVTGVVQKLARRFVEQGIRDRDQLIDAVHGVLKEIDPAFTRRQAMDAISGYGEFRQLTKDEISVQLRDLKGQMQQVAKLEDIQARKPPLKTGVERRAPSDEERRLIKLVNEAKRRFGIAVTDPATQLKSALEARKTYYRNQIADLEKQIAAKEKFVKEGSASPTDAELEALKARSTQLRSEFGDIFGKPGLSDGQRLQAMEKHAATLQAKIASGDISTAPARINRPLTPELEQAKQRVEELNKQLSELRKKPAEQKAAELVAKQIEALQKRIAEKESKISAGDISPAPQNVSRPQIPEIEIAKQRLEALNGQLAELRKAAKPKRTEEEIALQTLKTRLKGSIAKMEDQLKRGDFSKRQPVRPALDAEARRLSYEAAKVKAKWHEALMKDRLAKRTLPQKILGVGMEVLNTSRAILTSLDLSAVLRQGGFIAFGHPIRALKAFPAMFRALRSEVGQHAVNQEILARKNYPLYQQSKLYLSEHGHKLSQMEEAYMSRWAEKIPLVGASERAYVTFLNKLRADSFDAMVNALTQDGSASPVEAKAIANFINVATGRGKLGMQDNAAVGLNTIFFAPRYAASRFQLIAGQPLYRGTARTRIMVAKEYSRFLIGAGVVYGLAQLAGADIELDPRSSDFGKIRFGDTRIDPMTGLLQATVFLSRITSGETKRLNGRIVPIRGRIPHGGQDAADVTARFLRTKLSPVVGMGVNLASGKDVVGNPVTPQSVAQGLLVPLSVQDIYSAMLDQGVPKGTAIAILTIFGMGTQTFEPGVRR